MIVVVGIRTYTTLLLGLLLALPLSAQKAKRQIQPAQQKAKTTKVDKKTQLRREKAETERQRKLQQQRAAQLNKNIRSNLDSLLILDNQISRQQLSIDSLTTETNQLQAQIDTLERELTRLKKQLQLRKKRYARALVAQRKQKSIQQRLTFIFSASNLPQLLRRMRYIREYTTYQRAQGELIKQKQAEVEGTQRQLMDTRTRMQTSLNRMQEHQKQLEDIKASCQSKAAFLNKNLATVQQQIKDYQKKEQALSDQIDRLIQEEIEAERKRRAEEKAKREAAERARREAAERQAQAQANANTNAKNNKRKTSKSSTKSTKTTTPVTSPAPSDNGPLSKSFSANKGRLPMPATGACSIVGHYGNYNVSGLRGVTLNNKGIDIRTQSGASARAIFDGKVSSIFEYGGTYIVMLRHGNYISVYSGLRSVSVQKGQTVSTREPLGTVGTDSEGRSTLHFQLRNESTRLNPEHWIR